MRFGRHDPVPRGLARGATVPGTARRTGSWHACVAIEDNIGGVEAAEAAGVTVVAFPGENNADHDFDQAARRVDSVSLEELLSLVSAEGIS